MKMPTDRGLARMSRDALATFGRGHCLLEHLDDAEVDALSKAQLLEEVRGALLCAEVYEDRRALATDTVAKPVAEIIGCDL